MRRRSPLETLNNLSPAGAAGRNSRTRFKTEPGSAQKATLASMRCASSAVSRTRFARFEPGQSWLTHELDELAEDVVGACLRFLDPGDVVGAGDDAVGGEPGGRGPGARRAGGAAPR